MPLAEVLPDVDQSASGRNASANYHNASIITLLWLVGYALGVVVLLVALPAQSRGILLQNVLFTVASAQGNVVRDVPEGGAAGSAPCAVPVYSRRRRPPSRVHVGRRSRGRTRGRASSRSPAGRRRRADAPLGGR